MMMRKLCLVAALTAAMTGFSAANAAAQLKDGTWTGEGQGRNGAIVVELTAAGGKITAVKVVKHSETPGISDAALARVPGEIVQAQTTGIDAVSGATLTTNGIKAAVAAAIRAGGGDPAAFAAAVVSKKTAHKVIKESADIVVVGAGGAGISAAVKAETLGKSVILIEKMPTIGGATVLNAGTLIATGSRYQREVMKETKDSPELAYKDIFRVGKNRNDPVLVKMVTEKVGGVVDWLIYDMKIPYGPAATQYPDHSANRQLGVQGRSVNFLNLMKGKFLDMGGKLMLETRAQSFIEKDGKVVGVKAVDAAGNTVELTSKAVILASGGYGGDANRLAKEMESSQLTNRIAWSNNGEGLNMAWKAGAQKAGEHSALIHAAEFDGLSTSSAGSHGMVDSNLLVRVLKTPLLWVDPAGRRFANEELIYDTVYWANAGYSVGGKYFVVVDGKTLDAYTADKLPFEVSGAGPANPTGKGDFRALMEEAVRQGVAFKADTLEELAQKAGFETKGFVSDVKAYNQAVSSGKDPFGKPAEFLKFKVEKGPFYAARAKVVSLSTLGGVRVNDRFEALNSDLKPIHGLYAVGNNANGFYSAPSYPPYQGLALGFAWNSGRIAGKEAAEYVKTAK